LRVQQLELESLFHGPGSVAVELPSAEEAFARAREGLLELELSPAEVERALKTVRRAQRDGDGRVVTEVLNRLAFETGVDLGAARLVLTELWESLPRTPAPSPSAAEVRAE